MRLPERLRLWFEMRRSRQIVVSAKAVGRSTGPVPAHVVTGRLIGGRFVPLERYVTVEHAHVEDVDFSDLAPAGLAAWDSTFVRCRFDRLRTESVPAFGGGRRPIAFADCSFQGADLRSASFGDARFERCTFEGALISNWHSPEAEFVDCIFAGEIKHCVFYGRSLEPIHQRSSDRARNAFTGNDFRRAELRGVDFRAGIELERQLLPGDSHYVLVTDLHRRLAFARHVIEAMPHGEQRRLMTAVLKRFADNPEYRAQQSVLLNTQDHAYPWLAEFWRIVRSSP